MGDLLLPREIGEKPLPKAKAEELLQDNYDEEQFLALANPSGVLPKGKYIDYFNNIVGERLEEDQDFEERDIIGEDEVIPGSVEDENLVRPTEMLEADSDLPLEENIRETDLQEEGELQEEVVQEEGELQEEVVQEEDELQEEEMEEEGELQEEEMEEEGK